MTLLAGIVTLVEGWQPMSAAAFGRLALASVFLAGGYHAIISAMRGGELSVISPFRYTGLLWAVIVGFVIWDDIPNGLAWGGIALLIGSGVYILVAERRRALRPASGAAPPSDRGRVA